MQLMKQYDSSLEVTCDDGKLRFRKFCAHCGKEFTMAVREGNTLFCRDCGYEVWGDAYGFLHNKLGFGPEIRYVSDWSRRIHDALKQQIQQEPDISLSADCAFHMISKEKPKFVEVGNGRITLENGSFRITGTIDGEDVDRNVSAGNLPTLPFSPGKYLEIQDGSQIYRCVLQDGKLVMKFINMIKCLYKIEQAQLAKAK
jgi:ribosomal protein L33